MKSINDSRLFLTLLNRGFAAGILVLAVLALRLMLKKAPKWTHCVLWAFVALRLILPVGVVSPLSAFGVLPSQQGGSVEYFHAAGGSEKPLVEFDTVRIEAPKEPDETLVQIPNGLAVTRHRASRYLPPLEALWLAGLAGMALYALVSLLRLRRRVAASIPRDDGVFACDGLDAPFILGVFRPRIYLPAALSEPQRSHVLAHERAHLARRDHWWKPLGFALLAVYWFHPLLWLAYFLFCRDIERACDERVLRALDEPSRLDYSQSLLDLSRPHPALACPLAFGETGVRARIKAALRYKKPALWIVLAAIAVCAIAAVCFLTNPAYSTTVSPEEEQMLRQMMNEHGYSNLHLHTDVLYNRSGSAWCLLAKNDEMYMIVRRRGFRFSESGEGNPYEGYMDVPKFYPGPLSYWVRGTDAGPDSQAENGKFYDLRTEKPVGRVGLAASRVPYPQSSEAQTDPTQEPPERLEGPLLTVTCGDQSVGAYEAFLWSTKWNDDGSGISADGQYADDVIREHGKKIPVVTYSGDFSQTVRADAERTNKSLTVYADPSLEEIIRFADPEGSWIEELQRQGPGKYWCCQQIRLQGEYVPAADNYNTSCYNCIFCLEIPGSQEAVPEEFQDLFDDYPSAPAGELRKEPVVVTDQDLRIYNKGLWDEFYAKVQAGQPADVVLAFYLSGKEYADKPVFTSLRYDGSEFHMLRDSSRTGFGNEFYENETYRYLLEYDTGQEVIVMLSDEVYDEYETYKAAFEAAREDPMNQLSWSEHPPLQLLFWKKDAAG